MKKFTYLFIALFSLSLMTTSCREEKSTGDKIEEAVDEAGDAVEDAADEVEDAVDNK
jgi:predicted small secreted protein